MMKRLEQKKRPTGNRYFSVFEELCQVNRCSVKKFFVICHNIWFSVLRQVFDKKIEYLFLQCEQIILMKCMCWVDCRSI